MKKLKLSHLTNKLAVAAALVFTAVMAAPSSARADAIADAITNFDTTNIMTAGAAVIGLVIAIVGVKKVIQMIKGA
jgi:hypothetical protein